MGYDDLNNKEMESALSDTAVKDGFNVPDDDEGNEDSSQQADNTAGAGAQPSQGNNGQQQQPVWNGTEWSLKYRGNPYIPKSRDELVNLAQKGFSYTQEMERMNRERKEYQEQLNSLQGKYKHYDEFDAALKSNPALAQKLMQVAQEFQGQQGEQQASQGIDMRVYTQLQQRLDQLESMNTERINGEYDRKLADTIQNVKKSYPNHDWDFDDGTGNLEHKLLQFAYENGITNLDYAYRAMMWDQNSANAKADALKKAAATKQVASRAGVLNTSSSAGSSPSRPGYKYGDTYNDVSRKMAEEWR